MALSIYGDIWGSTPSLYLYISRGRGRGPLSIYGVVNHYHSIDLCLPTHLVEGPLYRYGFRHSPDEATKEGPPLYTLYGVGGALAPTIYSSLGRPAEGEGLVNHSTPTPSV